MNNIAGRLEKELQAEKKMQSKLKDLPTIFTEYYTSMRANRKSYTTINVYINNVLHFANFITKNKLTEDFYKNVSVNNVESYMISLETIKTKDGIKRTGDDILQARWSSLNTFFTWLVKRGYLKENPMEAINRPQNNVEHKVVFLNKTELNKLFKAVERNPNKVVSLRDKALFSLAVATGLRASALTNINLGDVDWGNKVVRVIEKRQKTREITLGDNTIQTLKKWIDVRNKEFSDVESNALFLSQKRSRLSGDAANDALKKYCKEAGIQKNITLHKLRSTSACTLAKNNIPVKAIAKQLGHSNIGVTMRYIDVFNEDMEKTRNVLDNLF